MAHRTLHLTLLTVRMGMQENSREERAADPEFRAAQIPKVGQGCGSGWMEGFLTSIGCDEWPVGVQAKQIQHGATSNLPNQGKADREAFLID